MDRNRLNIVDEQGDVIGEETHARIHHEGLLHKIVHVWFYTPDKQVIFQRRGKDAETNPNLLDATVGGHVEIGQSDIQAAVGETKEETSILLQPDDFVPIAVKKFNRVEDKTTDTTSSHLVVVFAYLFKGNLKDLQAKSDEDGGIRFESMPVDKVFWLTEAEKKQFIPALVTADYLEVFKRIKNLLPVSE